MKRFLLCLALFGGAVLALGQDHPPTSVDIPIPDPVVIILVGIFASGQAWYKMIDGIKNWIPWVKDNPAVLKWINIIGNGITLGGGCFLLGQVNNVGDALQCLTGVVGAVLFSAGQYESKKASDLARAGGAAAVVNVKAIAEVESGDPPPNGKGKK